MGFGFATQGRRLQHRGAVADLFWLSDEQWAVIEPFMAKNQPGPERDDCQIISGILHMLTSGCRWCDCPAAYGSRTTVYNQFNGWPRCGCWKAMLADLAKAGWAGDAAALDTSYVRAQVDGCSSTGLSNWWTCQLP